MADLAPTLEVALPVLLRSWRSLGLRTVEVKWELDGDASLSPPLAARLRSALGPALRAVGSDAAYQAVFESAGEVPPPLWFTGWDCPQGAPRRLRAGIRCVGPLTRLWTEVEPALRRMRLPGRQGEVRAVDFAVRSLDTGKAPIDVSSPLPGGGVCLVEAETPLQLRLQRRLVSEPPSLDVLVRSAGERFRLLCAHWGEAEDLVAVVGQAVREARSARLSWARCGLVDAHRRSSRSGDVQRISGLVGTFAYQDATPLALAFLALGAELGVGKDTAFGCGTIRLFTAAPEPR